VPGGGSPRPPPAAPGPRPRSPRQPVPRAAAGTWIPSASSGSQLPQDCSARRCLRHTAAGRGGPDAPQMPARGRGAGGDTGRDGDTVWVAWRHPGTAGTPPHPPQDGADGIRPPTRHGRHGARRQCRGLSRGQQLSRTLRIKL